MKGKRRLFERKSLWALICVHTGEVKIRSGKLMRINEVNDLDLMSFNTKKEAQRYVNEKLAWTLMPIKVWKECDAYMGEVTFYKFSKG